MHAVQRCNAYLKLPCAWRSGAAVVHIGDILGCLDWRWAVVSYGRGHCAGLVSTEGMPTWGSGLAFGCRDPGITGGQPLTIYVFSLLLFYKMCNTVAVACLFITTCLNSTSALTQQIHRRLCAEGGY